MIRAKAICIITNKYRFMSDFENYVLPSSKPVQIGELFRNNRFVVPVNQRGYSWDSDNWLDLWEDLQDLLRARQRGDRDSHDNFHFLGPMFFLPNGEARTLRILDGQQRLATLAIVEIVIYDLLDYKRAIYNISAEGANVLGRIHDSLLQTAGGLSTSRVKLGKDSSVLFDRVLTLRAAGGAQGDSLSKISTLREEKGEGKSNSAIVGCYRFYHLRLVQDIARINNTRLTGNNQDQLRAALSSLSNDVSESYLRDLHTSLSAGFYVLDNKVPDIGIMYEIFETLNQRGTKLLVSDLFKNFIFDTFEHDLGQPRMEDIWSGFSQIAGDDIDDFLRQFWLSNYEFVRKKKLFRD